MALHREAWSLPCESLISAYRLALGGAVTAGNMGPIHNLYNGPCIAWPAPSAVAKRFLENLRENPSVGVEEIRS